MNLISVYPHRDINYRLGVFKSIEKSLRNLSDKNAKYQFMEILLKIINLVLTIPKKLVLLLIRIYQKLFSFDHSFWANPSAYRVCVFHPSCSEFTYQAIEKHGLIKGGILGTVRIIRCNPFSKGGKDKVPEKFKILYFKDRE